MSDDFFNITKTTGLSTEGHTPGIGDNSATAPLELAVYAEAINLYAGLAFASANVVENRSCCGRVLLEAREVIKDREWKAWIKANTKLSYDTATRWMRLPAMRNKRSDQGLYTVDQANETGAIQLLEYDPHENDDESDDPDEEENCTVQLLPPPAAVPSIQTKVTVKAPAAVKNLPRGVPQPKAKAIIKVEESVGFDPYFQRIDEQCKEKQELYRYLFAIVLRLFQDGQTQEQLQAFIANVYQSIDEED